MLQKCLFFVPAHLYHLSIVFQMERLVRPSSTQYQSQKKRLKKLIKKKKIIARHHPSPPVTKA